MIEAVTQHLAVSDATKGGVADIQSLVAPVGTPRMLSSPQEQDEKAEESGLEHIAVQPGEITGSISTAKALPTVARFCFVLLFLPPLIRSTLLVNRQRPFTHR